MNVRPTAHAIVTGLLLASCTVIVKTDKVQCTQDSDCRSRGPDFENTVCSGSLCQDPPDPTWACIGRVPEPVAGASYDAAIRVLDLIAQKPPSAGSVKLCNTFDPACAGPILGVAVPPDGIVKSTVSSSFKGFFLIETPNLRPTLYFVDTGLQSATPATVALLSTAASQALNASLKATPDPSSGSVQLSVNDCTGKRARGVSFEVEPRDGAIPFYVVGSVVTPAATSTDGGGSGGFANLKEGTVTVTAKVESTGVVFARIATLIRSTAITYQPVRPLPSR